MQMHNVLSCGSDSAVEQERIHLNPFFAFVL